MSQSVAQSEWTNQNEYKAAWRALDVETQAEPTIHAGKLSAGTDAVSFTLAAFNVPDKFRAYVDALIGTSGGELDWFDAADIELGQRAREEGSGISKAALTKWTQRQRDAFNDWQDEHGITLIETLPGGQDATGTRHKTRYRLPLLALVLQVDERAKSSREWQRNKKKALRKAAAAVYQAERLTLIQPPRRERFKRRGLTADTCLKTAITQFDKAVNMALMEGGKADDFLDVMQAKLDATRDALSVKNDRTSNLQIVQTDELRNQMVDKYVHRSDLVETDHVETDAAVDAAILSIPIEQSMDRTQAAAGGRALCSLSLHQDMSDAQVAVDAFQSVGVSTIGITTDDSGRDEYKERAVQVLKRNIDQLIEQSEQAGGIKLFGRPVQPDTVAVIQVDDPTANLDELRQMAFLVIETSTGNIQGWLAVHLEGRTYQDIRRSVISYFGGDVGASGSTRWPGSLNHKYTPAFRVRVERVRPGHVLQMADIEHMMMPVEQVRPDYQVTSGSARQQTGTAYVPDWSRVAALHPDASRSQIDYYCALGAAQNGVSFDDAVDWLMSCSPKAAEKRGQARSYAELTVRNAYNSILPRGR